MATRNGSARWTGDLSSGAGRVTVGERAWTGEYSFASRFEDGSAAPIERTAGRPHVSSFVPLPKESPSCPLHGPSPSTTAAAG
jgi:osmotically inducible protein OsmC